MRKITFKNKKNAAWFLLLVLLIIVVNLSGFNRHIQNTFFAVSSSARQYLWQAGQNTATFLSRGRCDKILEEEIISLQADKNQLLSRLAILHELRKENEELRKALDMELHRDFDLLTARVISRDIFEDSFLINKGKQDGVSENQPVITFDKVLVGKIGKIYDNFSEVILISNQKSSFDAKIIDQDIFGLIRGKSNFRAYFDLVPRDKEIFPNQIIVSAALGGIFPAGLLVGEIREIERSDLEPFQQAEIDIFLDVRKIDYLFIITDF